MSSIFSRARRLWCTKRDWGSKRNVKNVEPQLPRTHSLHTKKNSVDHLPLPDPFLHSPTTPATAEQATGQNRLLDGAHHPACHAALTFLSVITLFLVPAMQPFNMTKSLFTSP